MPGARGETAAAVTDGRLYVIGGLAGVAAQATADVSVYDHGANAWSAGPPLPAARHHAAATAVGGSVYLTGGAASATDWGPTDTAWVLRPGESTWDAVAPMPGSRLGHRIVSLGSRLYVIGGVGRDAASSRGTVLTYDPAADAWSEGAALPVSRDHLAVVVVGDEIWAVGGRAGGINHARVDIYDPAADTWRDGPPLPEATSGAAEGVVDGVILLSGGEDPGAGRIVDRHWRLDTTLGPAATWETLSPPPWTVHGAPGVVLGGRFVVVSGSLRPGGQSSTAWTGATQALVAAP
jgi:N-acetylneuraminic acid mutarotase